MRVSKTKPLLLLLLLAACQSKDGGDPLPEPDIADATEYEIYERSFPGCTSAPAPRRWAQATAFVLTEPVAGGIDGAFFSRGIALAGGEGQTQNKLKDAWLFDLTNWDRRNADDCPWVALPDLSEPIWAGDMVFDYASQRFLVVGGYTRAAETTFSRDQLLVASIDELLTSGFAVAGVFQPEVFTSMEVGDPICDLASAQTPRGYCPFWDQFDNNGDGQNDQCTAVFGLLSMDVDPCTGVGVPSDACGPLPDDWETGQFTGCHAPQDEDPACNPSQTPTPAPDGSLYLERAAAAPGLAYSAVLRTSLGILVLGGETGCNGPACQDWETLDANDHESLSPRVGMANASSSHLIDSASLTISPAPLAPRTRRPQDWPSGATFGTKRWSGVNLFGTNFLVGGTGQQKEHPRADHVVDPTPVLSVPDTRDWLGCPQECDGPTGDVCTYSQFLLGDVDSYADHDWMTTPAVEFYGETPGTPTADLLSGTSVGRHAIYFTEDGVFEGGLSDVDLGGSIIDASVTVVQNDAFIVVGGRSPSVGEESGRSQILLVEPWGDVDLNSVGDPEFLHNGATYFLGDTSQPNFGSKSVYDNAGHRAFVVGGDYTSSGVVEVAEHTAYSLNEFPHYSPAPSTNPTVELALLSYDPAWPGDPARALWRATTAYPVEHLCSSDALDPTRTPQTLLTPGSCYSDRVSFWLPQERAAVFDQTATIEVEFDSGALADVTRVLTVDDSSERRPPGTVGSGTGTGTGGPGELPEGFEIRTFAIPKTLRHGEVATYRISIEFTPRDATAGPVEKSAGYDSSFTRHGRTTDPCGDGQIISLSPIAAWPVFSWTEPDAQRPVETLADPAYWTNWTAVVATPLDQDGNKPMTAIGPGLTNLDCTEPSINVTPTAPPIGGGTACFSSTYPAYADTLQIQLFQGLTESASCPEVVAGMTARCWYDDCLEPDAITLVEDYLANGLEADGNFLLNRLKPGDYQYDGRTMNGPFDRVNLIYYRPYDPPFPAPESTTAGTTLEGTHIVMDFTELGEPRDLELQARLYATTLHELAHAWFGNYRTTATSATFTLEALPTLLHIVQYPEVDAHLLRVGLRDLAFGSSDGLGADQLVQDPALHPSFKPNRAVSTYTMAQLHAVNLASSGPAGDIGAWIPWALVLGVNLHTLPLDEAQLTSQPIPQNFWDQWVAEGRRGTPLLSGRGFAWDPGPPQGEIEVRQVQHIGMMDFNGSLWPLFNDVPYRLVCYPQHQPSELAFDACTDFGLGPVTSPLLLDVTGSENVPLVPLAMPGGQLIPAYVGVLSNYWLIPEYPGIPYTSLFQRDDMFHEVPPERVLLRCAGDTTGDCGVNSDGDSYPDIGDCEPNSPFTHQDVDEPTGPWDTLSTDEQDFNCDGWPEIEFFSPAGATSP